MEPTLARPLPSIIGIAGRPTTDEEKSYVRQAVFLLRYRIKADAVFRAALAPADSVSL